MEKKREHYCLTKQKDEKNTNGANENTRLVRLEPVKMTGQDTPRLSEPLEACN
jgi:hypothetical protein